MRSSILFISLVAAAERSQVLPSPHHITRRAINLLQKRQNEDILLDQSRQEQVNTMLHDIFGDQASLAEMAKTWLGEGYHDASLQTPRSRSSLPKMWLHLTKVFGKSGHFDISQHERWGGRVGHSVQRVTMNSWSANHSQFLHTEGLSGAQCAETGDGHFLHDYFSELCAQKLTVDAYDKKADVPLDLNKHFSEAPKAVQHWAGKVNLLVCHQVFEHIKHPTVAVTNLNAIMQVGGHIVFSVPFLVQDHGVPYDFFRYTVRNVHTLLNCSGMEVKTLEGYGGQTSSLAYLAGATADDFEEAEERCDAFETNFCQNKYYNLVVASGIKRKDVTADEVKACFA